jgi:hypothetical protein
MSRKFNQAAPVADGRGAPGGNGGGTGAPPSNTAPDNCNPGPYLLRWGIDSLYLSYPGQLSDERDAELRSLKALAQGKPYEAAKAQLALGDHIFEVHDKGSGLFPFTLVDGAFRIQLAGCRSKKLPMAYVQVSSGYLAFRSPEAIEAELRALLRLLGDAQPPKVSRVDLFADFASTLDMEGWRRDAWVTRASAVTQYAEDAAFTGWAIGQGGALMARLYLKSLECQKTGKTYLLDLWKRAGWDEITPVWRLEFEFRREVLAQLDLDSLPGVLGNLDGLWSYASTEWLTLRMPVESDRTRSRWPIHPLWMALASVDWGAEGGPLSRSFTPSRAPSEEWIGRRALSLVASVASIKGIRSVEVASIELLHLASHALGNLYALSGISLDAGFAEMIEACNRRYNTRLNDQAEDEEADDPRLQNPYYRAKQGLDE